MRTFRAPGNRSFGSLHKHHRYPQSADRFGERLTPSFFPTSPRYRQRPISAAGCRRPASCRTAAAGEPTACLSGTCRRSRQSPREATLAAPRLGVRTGSTARSTPTVHQGRHTRTNGPTPSGSGRPAPGRTRARRLWDRADPPAEVFALVHDVARRRGQRTRGSCASGRTRTRDRPAAGAPVQCGASSAAHRARERAPGIVGMMRCRTVSRTMSSAPESGTSPVSAGP